MSHLSKIFLVFASLLFAYNSAFGCSCFLLPLEDEFKEADAVFMGKVSKPFGYDSKRFMHWQIDVTKVWKGDVFAVTELISATADVNPTLSYCMRNSPLGKHLCFSLKRETVKLSKQFLVAGRFPNQHGNHG